MTTRWSGLVSFALVQLLGLGWFATVARGAEVARRDDAYHFAFFVDGQHDVNYAEWWYFNLSDPSQGLQLALAYAILDPANLSGYGTASVTAIAYTRESKFTAADVYAPTSFHASYEQADVLVAGGSPVVLNSIQVLSDDVYHIAGSVIQGHRVSWNLFYFRRASPWFAADRQHVGVLPWEQMSWLQYMPGASVVGEVVVDGRLYRLTNTRGYHDHNWGEWIPFTVTWNWAQYFQPGIAFSIGDFRGSEAGVVSIEFLGTRSVFAKDQYSLTHLDWRFDDVNGLWFPLTTWLYARNEDSALIVRLRAIDTVPVLPPPQIPLPLVPVIYEQTADVLGWVWKKDQSGEWMFEHSFRGGGFNEYTDIAWGRPR